MDGNEHHLAEHPAALRAAQTWGVSLEEWLAYEYDQDRSWWDDYERWIAEMEEEAGVAAKLIADLQDVNAPF